MKLDGAAQAEMVKIAAIGLLAAAVLWLVKSGAAKASGALSDAVSGAVDKMLALPKQAWNDVQTAAERAVEVASVPFKPAPDPWTGNDLPSGWYRVQTPSGEIVTQYPRSITQTKLDQYGMVDP